jgi:hypothetical protein
MKLNYNILCLITFVLVFISCQNSNVGNTVEDYNDVCQFDWLIGRWEIINNDFEMYEIWTKINECNYNAESFVLAHGDTVFYEFVRLEQVRDEYFYCVSVFDQNNADEISFKMVSDSNNTFVFENLEHDFPQRIVYKNLDHNKIHVYIEGHVEGEYKREDFEFFRQK